MKITSGVMSVMCMLHDFDFFGHSSQNLTFLFHFSSIYQRRQVPELAGGVAPGLLPTVRGGLEGCALQRGVALATWASRTRTPGISGRSLGGDSDDVSFGFFVLSVESSRFLRTGFLGFLSPGAWGPCAPTGTQGCSPT